MRRPGLLPTLLLAAALALARRAHAEEVVVVLDRGAAARAEADRWDATAARLVEALDAAGHTARLLVYGTRKDGRARIGAVRGDVAEALRKAGEREGWDHEGPTAVERALVAARGGGAAERPDRILLVGPFAGPPDDDAEDLAAGWAGDAPPPRVAAIGLDEGARTRVAAWPGVAAGLAVVFAAGAPAAEPAPWSPLEDLPLVATVRVPLEVLSAGAAGPALVARTSGAPGPLPAAPAPEGGVAFRLERPRAAGLVATVSFAEAPGSLWLVLPPEPLTFRWSTLAPGVRLRDAEGRPAPAFVAEDVAVGAPRRARYRIERVRVGPPPRWRAEGEDGALPPGLQVTFGPELDVDEHLAATDVEVTMTAAPVRPLRAEGLVALRAAEGPAPPSLPYRVSVAPGRVVVRLDAPDPVRVPRGDADPAAALVVQAQNANAPDVVRARVHARPAAPGALVLRLASGGVERIVATASPFELDVGAATALRIDLAETALLAPAPWPGAREGAALDLVLVVEPTEGLEVAHEAHARVTLRRPRLVVAPGTAVYRVERGEVVAEAPLRLLVEEDGVGGDARRRLLALAPHLEAGPGDVALALQPDGPGAWRLVPEGAWRGPRADPFRAGAGRAVVDVVWDAGPGPGRLEVRVEVPPRWGRRGWLLVALAALALLLGGFALRQMRAPPVTGTLLYAVEGLEGAVGRLDLGGVGRGRAEVRADARGRLHLAGEGDLVVRVRASRVGGLLEVPGEAERRLLVDGLALATGRHRLRYVSGRSPEDAPPRVQPDLPDLLGPEYDLPTTSPAAAPPATPGATEDEADATRRRS